MQVTEKPKSNFRWIIIAVVMAWSIFQVVPSIRSISSADEKKSSISSLLSPVESSENQFNEWVLNYCDHLGISRPKLVSANGSRFIECQFSNEKEAKKFKKYSPYAFEKIKDPRIKGFLITPERAPGKEVRLARSFAAPSVDLFQIANTNQIANDAQNVEREYDEELFRDASSMLFQIAHAEPSENLQSITQFEIAFRSLVSNMKASSTSNQSNEALALSDLISITPAPRQATAVLKRTLVSSLDQIKNSIATSTSIDANSSFHTKKITDFETLQKVAESLDLSQTVNRKSFALHSEKAQDFEKFQSVVICDASTILSKEKDFAIASLESGWQPESNDLKDVRSVDLNSWESLNSIDQNLSLLFEENPVYPDSQFLVLKGFGELFSKSGPSESLQSDLNDLFSLLRQLGYTTSNSFSKHFNPKSDLLLEKSGVISHYLEVIHPDFLVVSTSLGDDSIKAIAPFDHWKDVLEGTISQYSKFQNFLVASKADFFSAKSGLNNLNWFEVPPPTKNLMWENFKLSAQKYWLCLPPWCLKWGIDLTGGKSLKIQVCDTNDLNIDEKISLAMGEIRERVDKFGLSDIVLRKQGSYLSVDLPDASPAAFKSILESPRLRFHIVDEEALSSSPIAPQIREFMLEVWNRAKTTHQTEGIAPHMIACQLLYGENLDFLNPHPQTELAKLLIERGFQLINPHEIDTATYNRTAATSRLILPLKSIKQEHPLPLLPVFAASAMNGEDLDEVGAGFDTAQGHYLSFSIRDSGKNQKASPRTILGSWTKAFCKDNVIKSDLGKSTGGRGWRMAVVLQDEIISAPTLEAPIDEKGMISGNFSELEVKNLAQQLKMGKLSFEPKIIEEISIQAEMGKMERNRGLLGLSISLVLVAALMMTYYRFGGIVTTVALILNIILMWAILQSLQAAISFPTLAGAILTLGMAVDANVLVFERIREELAQGQSLKKAISAGYSKAMTAIVDSNITTILAAVILACVDSGAVRGFALSLIVGIISSMFTSLFCTRTFFERWCSKTKKTTISMMKFQIPNTWKFVCHSSKAWIVCSVLLTTAVFGFISRDNSILGIDLSGGYASIIQLQEGSPNARNLVSEALQKCGFDRKDFQLQPLKNGNQFRLHLSKKLGSQIESSTMLIELLSPHVLLADNASEIAQTSWTSVSGQFSSKMVLFSVLGLGLAILGIFIYLALRFTPPFAISASLAMLVDLGLALCMIGVMRAFGVFILIDLQVIAALMTIIGYSLNDKIIIFDRIREQLRLKNYTGDIVNVVDRSVSSTLSRTFLTSFSTLLVVIPMLFFPSSSIFPFAVTMACGIVLGTLSSLYLAAPLVARLLSQSLSRGSIEIIEQ